MDSQYRPMESVVQSQPMPTQVEFQPLITQNYVSGYRTVSKGGCCYCLKIFILFLLTIALFPLALMAMWMYAGCSLTGRTWMLKQLRCCYMGCCFKFDCLSHVPLYALIKRYEEDPPPPVHVVVNTIQANKFMYAIMQTLHTNMPDLFFSFFPSGSLRERFSKILPSTSVLASDFDIMFIPDAIEIGHDNEPGKAFSLIHSDNFAKGHFWLKLNDNFLTQWSSFCLKRYHNDRGYNFLSSQKLHDHLKVVLQNSFDIRAAAQLYYYENAANVNITLEQSGPAMTFKVSALKANKVKFCGITWSEWRKHRQLFHADFTLAIHCTFWPAEAKGFFDANRRKNWPENNVVEKIKSANCHVVPKRSINALIKISLEQAPITRYGISPGLEWRYSFTQAEIFLCDDLPPMARTAYIAFKAMNKKHLNKRGCDMSSYVLKSILFYEVEKKSREYWEDDEATVVEDFFLTLMKTLAQCLQNKFCSHYWIPSINLMEELTHLDFQYKEACCRSIITRPNEFVGDNWLEYTRCLRYNCCYCGDRSLYKISSIGRGFRYDPEEQPCACCSPSYVYGTDDCCCGPCEYDSIDFEVY